MKLFSFLVLSLHLTFRLLAQTEEENLKATLHNYMDGGTNGDTARLSRSFYPVANQRNIKKDGHVGEMSIKNFVSKVPAGGVKRTTSILSYSIAGNAATATIESIHDTFKFVDFLNLLKIQDDWKIVSRVFTRVDLDEKIINYPNIATVVTPSSSKKNHSVHTTPATVKKPAPTGASIKPKADDGW